MSQSETDKSATDAVMIIASMAQEETRKGKLGTLLGKDVVSAFNNLRLSRLLEIPADSKLDKEADFWRDFLQPRRFQFAWDSEERGTAHIDDGLSIHWPYTQKGGTKAHGHKGNTQTLLSQTPSIHIHIYTVRQLRG